MAWNNLFLLQMSSNDHNNDEMIQSLEKSLIKTTSTSLIVTKASTLVTTTAATTTSTSIRFDWNKLSSDSSAFNSSDDNPFTFDVLFNQESTSTLPITDASSQSDLNESMFSAENIWNILLVSSYSLIVLVSLFGNIFVCRVMIALLVGNGRNTTNILIFNLAIADLLLTCFNIPINIVRFVSTNWPFGSVICILTPFIQSLSAHCSSITMMVIAFERYRSLIRTTCFGIGFDVCQYLPYMCNRKNRESIEDGTITHSNEMMNRISHQRSTNQWKCSICLIWICSIVLSIPHCLFNQLVVYPSLLEGFNMIRCATVFPSKQNRLMLAILSPLSQYLLPIGLTALFYARIGCFLWRQNNPIGSVSANRRASIMKRKRKRIKMLVIVVAVFATCWFPLHLYVTLIDFKIIQHHFGIYFVTHWIAMSSVCYNPFIYCWLNETFRLRTDSFIHSLTLLKNRIQRFIMLCCSCNRNPNEIVNKDLNENNANNANENNIDQPKKIIEQDQNNTIISICNDEKSSTF
ncbi:G-protein coupled receptor 83 [Dermatophagoides farinae]|uniref:G-protein coupled receptor 83 n=1 Tax=Dermatophagoides farinae TaxID=6954 RepID=UPI003F5F7C5B